MPVSKVRPGTKPHLTSAQLLHAQEKMFHAQIAKQNQLLGQGVVNTAETLFRQLSPTPPHAVAATLSLSARFAIETAAVTPDLQPTPNWRELAERLCDTDEFKHAAAVRDYDAAVRAAPALEAIKSRWLADCELCWEDQLKKFRMQKEIHEKLSTQLTDALPEGAKVVSMMQLNADGAVPAGGEPHADEETSTLLDANGAPVESMDAEPQAVPEDPLAKSAEELKGGAA
jgi:hypothetical protein